jgi:hypothetical protein
VFIQAPRIKAGEIPVGERIQAPPQGLQAVDNLEGIPLLGAFKEHVFQKMGDPALCVSFVPRPHLHPGSKGDGPNKRNLLGQDSETIVQLCFSKTPAWGHRIIPPTCLRRRLLGRQETLL